MPAELKLPAPPAEAEQMLWLGDRPRRWAMLHRPYDAAGRLVPPRLGVVFCSPFAEEEKCSRRLYVELARALARRGAASLRISYAGTADSEGEFTDFGLQSALGDIRLGLDCLTRDGQAPLLATFGLRLGGALALMAADNGAQKAALWSPVVNGRSYVRMNFRRKAIRQMMNEDGGPPSAGTGEAMRMAESRRNPASSQAVIAADVFDFDGYPVARSLWDELEGLESQPAPEWRGESLVVSVGPSARPAPESSRLVDLLRDRGVKTRLECIVAQPFWNLLGLVECPEIVDLTARWLVGEEES